MRRLSPGVASVVSWLLPVLTKDMRRASSAAAVAPRQHARRECTGIGVVRVWFMLLLLSAPACLIDIARNCVCCSDEAQTWDCWDDGGRRRRGRMWVPHVNQPARWRDACARACGLLLMWRCVRALEVIAQGDQPTKLPNCLCKMSRSVCSSRSARARLDGCRRKTGGEMRRTSISHPSLATIGRRNAK